MSELHEDSASQAAAPLESADTKDQVNICIVGWYGANSTGDNAILTQFIRAMVPSRDVHLTIISYNARRAYEIFARPNINAIEHLRLFGQGGLKNLLRGRIFAQARAVARADLLVVGGGSLLHDRLGLRNLMMTLDEIWWAKLWGRPVAIFSMGVGPLKRRFARGLVAKTVSLCDVITVRDNGSKQLLVEIGVPAHRITVVGDPAFLLKPVAVSLDQAPWLHESTPNKEIVGVFLADSLEYGSSDERDRLVISLATAFDQLHDKYGLEFVFLPFLTQMQDDDRIIAHDVVAMMKSAAAVHVIDRTFEPEEMIWIESQFSFNITVRFHALLFSLLCKVPAIPIEYDPKVGHAMRDFGLGEYLVPLDAQLMENLVTTVGLVRANRDRYVEQVARELSSRQSAARESFQLLRDLLAVSGSPRVDKADRSTGVT